jgi:hypothetical protein
VPLLLARDDADSLNDWLKKENKKLSGQPRKLPPVQHAATMRAVDEIKKSSPRMLWGQIETAVRWAGEPDTLKVQYKRYRERKAVGAFVEAADALKSR